MKSPRVLLRQLYNYMVKGEGYLLGPIVEACIFARSELIDPTTGKNALLRPEDMDASNPKNLPDFEIMSVCAIHFIWLQLYSHLYPKIPIGDPSLPGMDKSKGVFGFLACILHPQSRGTLRLRSSDPFDEPLCDMNYLSAPEDYTILRAALRFSVHLAREMQASGYPLEDVIVPSEADLTDDAALDAYIRKWTGSQYHYSSTCRMAPLDDADGPGVVDDELRVHGVRGLRIADASIFPRIPGAHPQAPVVAVAEKCADMVKASHPA